MATEQILVADGEPRDRLDDTNVRQRGLRHAEITTVTVNYHCLWSLIYE